MIAKLHKGKGFRAVLEYSFRVSKGYLLDSNMGGTNPRELSKEFNQIRQLRPEIKRPMHFTSLSLAPGESLSDQDWTNIAKRYVVDMGFKDNQYLAVRHTDTKHSHIHIIINRISLTGKLTSDSKDYARQETIMRQVEQEYELSRVTPSREAHRRRATKGELEQALRTKTPSTKMILQKIIDQILPTVPSLFNFTKKLESFGVSVRLNKAKSGHISGISFTYEDTTMKGSDLGRGYTWSGLQKRGMSHEQIRYAREGSREKDTARATATGQPLSRGISETVFERDNVDRGNIKAPGNKARYGQKEFGERTFRDKNRTSKYLQVREGDSRGVGETATGRSICFDAVGQGDEQCYTHDRSATGQSKTAEQHQGLGLSAHGGDSGELAMDSLIEIMAAKLQRYSHEPESNMVQARGNGQGPRHEQQRGGSKEKGIGGIRRQRKKERGR